MEMWMLSLVHVSPLRKAGASRKMGTSGIGLRTTSRWTPVAVVAAAAAWWWLVRNRRKDRRPRNEEEVE